jgi:hypothetical protein
MTRQAMDQPTIIRRYVISYKTICPMLFYGLAAEQSLVDSADKAGLGTLRGP